MEQQSKTYLTPHFTLEEMTNSQKAAQHGIDNRPNPEQIQALTLLCIKVLEPVRELTGGPIFVTSGFRSYQVNQLVGGTKSSQHRKGEAADIHSKRMTIQSLFELIVKSDIPFDQVIQEFDEWVHVSFSATRQRRQALIARRVNGRVKYKIYKQASEKLQP